MGAITTYQHHGTPVHVDGDLKGLHREHCLCFRNCAKFKPSTPDNCKIAAATFKNCVKFNTVTPVYECPQFEEGA